MPTTAAVAADVSDLPVYDRDQVPEGLRTKTQLRADRLKPATGQRPLGFLRAYRRGHGWGKFPLYDPAQAAKMRPLSGQQRRAMQARRTCPECEEVRGYVIAGASCQECRDRAYQERVDLQRRTCRACRRISLQPLPHSSLPGGRRSDCIPCWLARMLRRQVTLERQAAELRTCPGPGCTEQTATEEEITAAQAAGRWFSPRWCPPCAERDEQQRAERLAAAREEHERAQRARERRIAALTDWARTVLADQDAVILDTETTGLHAEARIVDIAVLAVSGDVVVDALVNPGEPIPDEATAIHGLGDRDVAAAASFPRLLEQLSTALVGRRCLIYNKSYDVARLRHELVLHYRQAEHPDPQAAAQEWLDQVRFEDVMLPYSEWAGEWSDYWGGYAWQRLYGGNHRALGDCRAVVDRLQDMARDRGGELPEGRA
ncbi:exonuclease domain-containing protein (plasmid) [Streptomyces sp. SDT5-1]|uniref:exonuclease domain-containing protein n=1 Tax=Streptomyces sp. SDT5-1 TaxID=3406418 RepID=UPI003FD08671